MWARQSYRFSPIDFEANAKEGVAIPWPVTYDEIAPWYDKAETFAGISGSLEDLPQLPDGKFLPPHDLKCVEVDFKKRLEEKLGPRAHHRPLREPHRPARAQRESAAWHLPGAQPVHSRLSLRWLFQSVSSTLPSAERTGKMTLLPNQIVYEVIYDNDKGKATGVRVMDAETSKQTDYFAKICS